MHMLCVFTHTHRLHLVQVTTVTKLLDRMLMAAHWQLQPAKQGSLRGLSSHCSICSCLLRKTTCLSSRQLGFNSSKLHEVDSPSGADGDSAAEPTSAKHARLAAKRAKPSVSAPVTGESADLCCPKPFAGEGDHGWCSTQVHQCTVFLC